MGDLVGERGQTAQLASLARDLGKDKQALFDVVQHKNHLILNLIALIGALGMVIVHLAMRCIYVERQSRAQ
ncbi:unnamed protein product, partial [Discosporangium mesarthrocarpum]